MTSKHWTALQALLAPDEDDPPRDWAAFIGCCTPAVGEAIALRQVRELLGDGWDGDQSATDNWRRRRETWREVGRLAEAAAAACEVLETAAAMREGANGQADG